MSSLRLWSASEREGKGCLKRHPAFDCKRDGQLARGHEGSGLFRIGARHTDGTTALLTFRAEPPGGSTWQRSGDEWRRLTE